MNNYESVTDACEECTVELPAGSPERIQPPVLAVVQGDCLECLYFCARHDRTWSCHWYIPALGVAS